ncbi:hypothetical protein FEDK69T_25960 [Flavobacterium enshiense DK69]|nr:hypothetical protein FEDK69T_25960 [Flavobacterium enshiense DK69]
MTTEATFLSAILLLKIHQKTIFFILSILSIKQVNSTKNLFNFMFFKKIKIILT